MFEYKILAQSGQARVGEFSTPHGTVTTPMFMPVGTHGAVKAVSPAELQQVGSQMILANTYHLYLRPGEEIVAGAGGLHGFMGYDRPILTDSGGFQVFSLGERGIDGTNKTPLRQVTEEGTHFSSHLDGSKHLLTPEKSIQIQQSLAADVIMAFDQPVYGLTAESEAREAMERSMRWLDRSKTAWQAGRSDQALFGIVQGGLHQKLHTESAQKVVAADLPGNAIGGLAIGGTKEQTWAATGSICALLPPEKPRYFMGLGEPLDLIEAVSLGVDMFDCVIPSRLARHGVIWEVLGSGAQAFWEGQTEKILGTELQVAQTTLLNSAFKSDYLPLNTFQSRLPIDLQPFSRATLHHYLKTNEMLGYRITTLHNLAFLHILTEHLRTAIQINELNKLRAVFGLLS